MKNTNPQLGWRVKMNKLLLTACAFALFSSSAFAEEKSLEELDKEGNRIWGTEGVQKYQFTRIVPSTQPPPRSTSPARAEGRQLG